MNEEVQGYIAEIARLTNEKSKLEDLLKTATTKNGEWLSLLKYFYAILTKLVGRFDSAGYSREHIAQLTELDEDMINDMIEVYKEEVEKAKAEQNEVAGEGE